MAIFGFSESVLPGMLISPVQILLVELGYTATLEQSAWTQEGEIGQSKNNLGSGVPPPTLSTLHSLTCMLLASLLLESLLISSGVHNFYPAITALSCAKPGERECLRACLPSHPRHLFAPTRSIVASPRSSF